MDASGLTPKDQWIARGASLALHALLLLWLVLHVAPAMKTSMVIFSVETVSGLTPQGEGSGAQGAHQQINNAPANLNPLAGGLNLKVSDPPVPAAAKPSAKPVRSKPVAAAPTLQDLQKQNESLPIGLKPRHSQGAEEPSEGGMGNAHQAGVEGGVLGLQGAIAGRGYNPGDYSYGKPLPGESEVVVALVVGPKGEVLSAQIKKTSGYPELDMHALAKAREVMFDALPSNVPQEPAAGTVRFKFEYSGRAIP